MSGTKFRKVIRESLGNIGRELKVAFTPMPKNKKWVFIVGCYNSGTTLLAELMSRHPKFSVLPTEGHFITDEFVKDYDIGVPRMWVDREDVFRLDENDNTIDVARVKKEWGMRLDLSKGILVEKSPPNAARTKWLQKNFENSHFIAIVRNGYAVAEGISRKGDPKHLAEGWPIDKSAWQWARGNEILVEDSKSLKNLMWLSYEDLTETPIEQLNRISQFLGVEGFDDYWGDEEFAIHERKEAVTNLNSKSIKKLSTQDIEIINKVAGKWLDYFGYERLS